MAESNMMSDEEEGHIADIGPEDDRNQELVPRNRNIAVMNTSSENQIATQNEKIYGVSGGDFKNATFGSPQYTLTKQDGVIDGDFRRQIFHNTYNTYITEPQSYVSDETLNDTASQAGNFGEGWMQLSDKIGLFKTQPLCKRAHVYKGLHLSQITGNLPIAVKFLTPYDDANMKEAKILTKLRHHNVVSIIHSDVYNEGPFPTMYIAMELCLPKTLNDYIIEHKNEEEILNFAEKHSMIRQLTDGLEFIHHNHVLHRDLKPENILFSLDGRSLKISDFGLSKELSHGRSVTAQSMIRPGTDGYRAPETYNSDMVSKQADIFSYGLVIYFILSDGHHAFGDEPDLWNYNIKKNKNRNVEFLPIPRSESAKELVEWTLQYEPTERPTCKQIIEHDFLVRGISTKPKVLYSEEDGSLPPGETTSGMAVKYSSSNLENYRFNQEVTTNTIVVFDRDSNDIVAFSPSVMCWIPMQCQKIPEDIIDNNFHSMRLNNSIYVIMESKAVYCLNYTEKEAEWKRVADMIESHGWYAPAEALDGCIYVVGRGYSPYPTSSRKHVERYNPENNEWTRVRDMNGKRENHYIAAWKGCIYCFGGRDEYWNSTPEVERYHADTDVWETMSPMPRPMDFPPMRAVVLHDVIYVMNRSDIQMYDTINDSWTIGMPGGPFPYDQGLSFKAFALDNTIYGVGRKSGKIQIHRLELSTMKWSLSETVNKNILPRECVDIFINLQTTDNQVFHHYQ